MAWANRALAEGPSEGRQVVVLAADRACALPELPGALQVALERRGLLPLPACAIRGAVARARSIQALASARKLFLRTDFAGCAALLAIGERELAGNLSGLSPALTTRAHQVLAELNLWLGVCQWLSNAREAAAEAFRRSARLPSPPLPTEGELPPAVVSAYRDAVREVRSERVCDGAVPRGPHLFIDGKPVPAARRPLRLVDGSHYVAWACAAGAASGGCRQRLSARGCSASQRLEVGPDGCRQTASPPESRDDAICLGREEARTASFGAGVLAQSGARQLVVVESRQDGAFAVRLLRPGHAGFTRQVKGQRAPAESEVKLVADAFQSALAIGTPELGQLPPQPRPWYREWWFWAIAGAAAGVAGTLTVVTLTN